MGSNHELKLNRKLQNHTFNSWRLGADNHAAASRSQISLPYPAFVPPVSDPQDFLHVREALLHNSLARSKGNCFVALHEPEGLTIQHLCATATGDGVEAVLERVAGPLPVPQLADGQEPALSYSLAVVQGAPEGTTPLLLFSTGQGDLHICELDTLHEGNSISAPIYPFQSRTSDTPRSFIMEAAYTPAAGVIRCVAWLITPRAGSKHVSCKMYILTVSHTSTAAAAEGQSSHTLEVVSAHPLHQSHLPPHAVVVDQVTDSLLLAVAPAVPEDEDQPPQQPGAAGTVDDDEEEGDKEPRNLEEAAARLDKYTTEHAVGQDSKPAWDVNEEDGGDTLGEVGSEPACELLHFVFGTDNSKGPTHVWTMSFGAHKLLGVQEGADGSFLLGVSDDVDCALVRIQLQQAQKQPVVVHEGFAPALAYVITGKVQRRHVLLGGLDGMVAAVIVECQKYCYLYKQVDRRAEFGEQQVIDMQLEDDEGILGAQLVNGPSGLQVLLLLTKTKIIAFKLS